MRIPIVRSEPLIKVLAERSRQQARGRPSHGPSWDNPSSFSDSLAPALAPPAPPASAIKDLPLWHLLGALLGLLAIAILMVVLLAPDGPGPAQTLCNLAASAIEAPLKSTLAKEEGQAGTPTCLSCGHLMVTRRNRETGEVIYVCKSPTCQQAAPTARTSARQEGD